MSLLKEGMQNMEFDEAQLERYSRHIMLKDVGIEGQKKLSSARVLVIGAGGLGSPSLLYLAAAGIGTIGIADGDVVDLSNLQRQVIHSTEDIGTPKVLSAKKRINALNPEVNIEIYYKTLNSTNLLEIIKEYDFVIDGADNFETKFLINDVCILNKVPFSHGGILEFAGQTLTILPGSSPCYRCLFLKPPPADVAKSRSQAGVVGAVAGIIGTLQANEAIKYVLAKKNLLTGRLLTFDALETKFREVKIRQNPKCGVCGTKTITTLIDD